LSVELHNSKSEGIFKNLQLISLANLLTISRLVVTPFVTKHGELLDPAVDKIFTISVLVAFVEKQIISTFIVFLIVLREMIITWFRSVMVNRGIVIPASFYGKLKTTLQLVAIFLLSINMTGLGVVMLWLSIIVAYFSAFDYLKLFIKRKVWE